MTDADHLVGAATDYRGAKTGMWLFLFTELLFFGGLFLLYAVFRLRYADGFHAAAGDESIVIGTVNTCLLLTGSLFAAASLSAIRRGRHRLSALLQALVILSGALFLTLKLGLEWPGKIARGLYPGSVVLDGRSHGEVLFFGLYYVMTGIHGLHVLAGGVLFSVTLALTGKGALNSERYVLLENAGLFWHFVDIIWIYLFPLFYLVT